MATSAMRIQRGPLVLVIPENDGFRNDLRRRIQSKQGVVFASCAQSSPLDDVRPPSPRPESPYTPIEEFEPSVAFDLEGELDQWQQQMGLAEKQIERLQSKQKQLKEKREKVEKEKAALSEQAKPLAEYVSALKTKPRVPLPPSPFLICRSWEQQNIGDKMVLCQKLVSQLKELDDLLSGLDTAALACIREIRSISSKIREKSREKGLRILCRGLSDWVERGTTEEEQRARATFQKRVTEVYNNSSKNVLNLDDLGLSELPGAIVVLRNVKYMYARRNKLTELPSLFSRMTQLQVLNLSENLFPHVPAHLPPNLTSLYFVDNPGSCNSTELEELQKVKGEDFRLYIQ